MKILIVEDDHLQADWLHKNLNDAFPEAEIWQVSTEFEFRSRFEEFAQNTPDVIVLDIMLRWADPPPDFSPPPRDVQEQGFYRAGLRSERLLAQEKRTQNIPIILYTVLEQADLNNDLKSLPNNVHYVTKKSDFEPLIQKISELTRQPRVT